MNRQKGLAFPDRKGPSEACVLRPTNLLCRLTTGWRAGWAILLGDKVGNLPVQHLTQYELVVSLETAKTPGLTIPPSILIRADEVIK